MPQYCDCKECQDLRKKVLLQREKEEKDRQKLKSSYRDKQGEEELENVGFGNLGSIV